MQDIKTIHKEDISRAYLQLLAAANDVTKISKGDRDFNGVDCTLLFSSIEGVDFADVEVAVQIKASINVKKDSDENYFYNLPTKNYNKFCGKSQLPRVFTILELPRDEDWVIFDETNINLLAKSRMFWYVLPKGTEMKANPNSTVKIPLLKENYLTVENFISVFTNIVQEFYSEEGL